MAGSRKGLAGERSGLWFEFRRIIAEYRPRWVVIENVPGLLSSNGGRDFATVVQGLAKCGYGVAWRVLDAQYFGVAQRRRRVFIVGSLGDGRAAEILFESNGREGDYPPGRKAGADIAATITKRFAGGSNQWAPYNEADNLIAGSLQAHDKRHGHAMTTQQAAENGQLITAPLTGNPYGDHESRESLLVAFGGNNTSGEIEIATAVNAHGSRRYDFESETFIAATLNSGGNSGGFRTEPGEHLIPWHENTAGQFTAENGDIAKALRAGASHSYQGIGVRRLTPVECERLQGFPDGWTAGQTDSARYRQLGNAVAVPVAEWLGRQLTPQLDAAG